MNFCDLPEVLSPSRNAAPLQRSNSAASSVFRSATEQAGVAFPNTLKAGQDAVFSVIADEIPSTENKGYPPGLFVAAANAVNGLAISAGGLYLPTRPRWLPRHYWRCRDSAVSG